MAVPNWKRYPEGELAGFLINPAELRGAAATASPLAPLRC
jgi:hypothetical protein